MAESKKKVLFIYILLDWLASIVGWASFFIYRKKVETPWQSLKEIVQDDMFIPGLAIIPICWIILYGILGSYGPIYRKSRLVTVYDSFLTTLVGCLGLLFLVLVDDTSLGYVTYFESFIVLFGIQLFWILMFRILFLNFVKGQLSRGEVQFHSVLISDQEGHSLMIPGQNRIAAHIGGDDNWHETLVGSLPDAEDLLIDVDDQQLLREVLDHLGWYVKRVTVKISERTFEACRQHVNVDPRMHKQWVTLDLGRPPLWQMNLKRIFDVVVSALLLIILSPVLLYCAVRIRMSSRGDIIFKQERIGLYGRPFDILKLRSMYEGAEENGPELSFLGDKRCTPWGAFMRKWRLDEIPQFINVLQGQMSLVGPRPERQHFIDQLKQMVPNYDKILSVRPGITSWGQVKYGYASNVDEMLKRLRYDMLYVDKINIILDLKILYHTIAVLFQGKGK